MCSSWTRSLVPPGTTIYDWDADKWNGLVLRPAPGGT